MDFSRIIRHLLLPPWRVAQVFPSRTLDAIEAAVGEAERQHRGEIRFAVEGALHWPALWHAQSARDRAIEVFSRLRVWDTELNTGVLVYLLLADHAVEIVADRGINAKVDPVQWQSICASMQTAFAEGRFEAGAVQGLRAIADLLRRHFATDAVNPNELPNRPVVL
jgi:uncharacterized membrane protein